MIKIFIIFIFNFSLKDLKESYKNVESIYAEIKEIIYSGKVPTCTLYGKIYVKRPDFFKMVIEKPESQVIYSTKDSTLIYFPSWKELQIFETPKFIADFFLLNFEEYSDSISFIENNFYEIKIFPKKEFNIPYERIILNLNKKNKNIERICFIQGEVDFEFNFLLFKKNEEFETKIFFQKDVKRIKVQFDK
jgi:outer membrane lipoprotein-sorting protein